MDCKILIFIDYIDENKITPWSRFIKTYYMSNFIIIKNINKKMILQN